MALEAQDHRRALSALSGRGVTVEPRSRAEADLRPYGDVVPRHTLGFQISPIGGGRIIAIDPVEARLTSAREFGADLTINNADKSPVDQVMELTDGLGVDLAMEAVGLPQTFELATDLVRPGGHVANIGVHGKPATLHLERLWIRDVTITTGLVDTCSIPQLLSLIQGRRREPTRFATHQFSLGDVMAAYDVFADAGRTQALKVVLQADAAPNQVESMATVGAGV